jgi:lipoate-protein ligase A
MDPTQQTLYIWRNQETVVIGRNQNPWSECNLSKMEEDGVFLARRMSGGGAVFHDLGNTCFTFLSPKEGYDRNANIKILLAALKRLGVTAEASGRNDLIVNVEGDGGTDIRKISGSAYRETRDRCFHHGTFLINADLTRLANYLTPHPKKLQSKGRASVRSRVINLKELAANFTHEALSEALIEEFFSFYGARAPIEHLDHGFLSSLENLQKTYDQFASWDWRFGHAPQFHHEMTEYLGLGFMQVFVDVDHAMISRAKVFSDALFPDLIEEFERELVGKPYSQAGMSEALQSCKERFPQLMNELAELETWLKSQVEV